MLMTVGPVGSIPAPAGASVAMAMWAIACCLKKEGHRVSVCHIMPMYTHVSPEEDVERCQRVRTLQEMGIPTYVVESIATRQRWLSRMLSIPRMVLFPRVFDFFPEVVLTSQVEKIFNISQPDAIYHHGLSSLATTYQFARSTPTLVITGDIEEQLIYYRWRLTPIKSPGRYCYRFFLWLGSRRLPKIRATLLKCCRAVITNAHHATEVLARQGARAEYLPTPCAVNDLDGVCLVQEPACKPRVPRLLMLGHLGGTATRLGLHFFADKVLPSLENSLGKQGFEVHILGRDDPDTCLKKKLYGRSVKLRGYVDDLTDVYRQTDIMLAMTPVPTGVRTRIAEALSAGCCIIAHSAESAGMPELIHGENVLLGSDGSKIVAAILQALENPDLRSRLGQNARVTYERYFAPPVSMTRLVERIKDVGGLK